MRQSDRHPCSPLSTPTKPAEEELSNPLPTYLLSWNPMSVSKWPNNGANSAATRRGEIMRIRWSTGGLSYIAPGDRIFLGKLGQHPMGVIASNVAASDCFEDIRPGSSEA